MWTAPYTARPLAPPAAVWASCTSSSTTPVTSLIDSGALVERVNFVGKELGNPDNPGVKAIIDRMATQVEGPLSPDAQVDACVDLIGPLEIADTTRTSLSEFAAEQGEADLRSDHRTEADEQRIANLLRLLTATREYQLA